MSQIVTANMPDTLNIGDGYIIELDAINPTTGASVSGVVVTNVNVAAAEQGGGTVDVGTPILIGVNV